MNSDIEVNSLTWSRVADFCAQVRREAVEDLISDRNPERARGAIQTVDRLLALGDGIRAPVIVSESYD